MKKKTFFLNLANIVKKHMSVSATCKQCENSLPCDGFQKKKKKEEIFVMT